MYILSLSLSLPLSLSPPLSLPLSLSPPLPLSPLSLPSLPLSIQMYSQYISNFDTALKTLEEQQKKNSLFSQVIKEFELEPMCSNLTVAAYLLETVQRIPRYKLLLAGE